MTSLLHDVGKLWQGTGKSASRHYPKETCRFAHAGLAAEFIRDYLDKELGEAALPYVLNHHQPEKAPDRCLALAVQVADWLSSGERRGDPDIEQQKGGRLKNPLVSIFSELRPKKGWHREKAKPHYVPLRPLEIDAECLTPVAQKTEALGGRTAQEAYKTLWQGFGKDIKQVHDSGQHSLLKGPRAYFETILHLYRRYAWAVPSATPWEGADVTPDISLYDHSRMTAALAACLVELEVGELKEIREGLRKSAPKDHPGQAKDPFLFVSGDISGIQNFITRMASPSEVGEAAPGAEGEIVKSVRKGAAKRLRGRSFTVKLLADLYAHALLEALGLWECNLLWSTGGKFLLLAPNTDANKSRVQETVKDLSRELLSRFGSQFYVSVVTEVATVADLNDFAGLKERIEYGHTSSKRRKWAEALAEPDFFEQQMEWPQDCPVCGLADRLEKGRCGECERQEELGQRLAHADYLVRVHGPASRKCLFNLGRVGFEVAGAANLAKTLEGLKQASYLQVLDLAGPDFLEGSRLSRARARELGLNAAFGFAVVANHVPRYKEDVVREKESHREGDPLTFGDLAKEAVMEGRGVARLAVVKGDVDDLGWWFSQGLSKENRTISRIATLSSSLELFFGGLLDNIAQQKDLYTIYAGGDDFLLVGPWNRAVEAALEIERSFKRYTCGQPTAPVMSLSAGVSLFQPHYPVSQAIKETESLLGQAKHQRWEDTKGDSKRKPRWHKDRCSLFEEVLPWHTLPILPDIKGVEELLGMGRTLEGNVVKQELSSGFLYLLLRLWHQSYKGLERAESLLELSCERRKRREFIPLLKYQLARNVRNRALMASLDKAIPPAMPWIRVPVSWAALNVRNYSPTDRSS